MRSIPLQVTVTAHDGRTTTLATEGGHVFSLTGHALPGPCEPGSTFCLPLEDVAGWPLAEPERVALSRAMLHEMLTVT